MELRKIIRTDITASAIAHLTLVALIIVISEVHPFHSAPSETVAVDIVTPEQVKQQEAKAEEKAEEKAKKEAKEEAKEKPSEPPPDLKLPKLDFTDKDKPDTSPQPAAKEKLAPQQKQAAHEAQQKQPAMPQPQAAAPAYQPPEPDVTIKYGVMLGLPPASKDAPKDDGGDAKDSIAAKLPPEVITELRRHLRSCLKLPAEVAPTDAVRIRLRMVMATDGTLARPPILIEAPPSAKGVAIVKSAISATQACQPYKMLPPDKYEEWKVMDLSFTPRDFGS
ncbi:hypothetical protein [Bradyrhizobium sp. BR 10261]|uniref:hypothetical protein n=1 Tax=Bradyrhizobium sp. BR 10261 TaxID=2749992 RepID=UPI001C646A15|nr:hypothetical protein [Bradyrhizobium sp. BR 10261]MBW7965879.1 hypothetical protein [Bradyrhizobium sp. BR 10261]